MIQRIKALSLNRIGLVIGVVVFLLCTSVAVADIVSSTFTTNASNDVTITQLTLNKPTSVAEGDFLLANVAVNGGNAAVITEPSGWTQILRTDNGSDISIISYYKIVGASEPSSYTWSVDHQTTAEGGITRYTGVNTTNPINATSSNTGFGTVATTSSLVTNSEYTEIVTLFAADIGKSANAGAYFTTPTGMTEKYDISNVPFGPSTAFDDAVQATAGTTTEKSSTISGGKARNWVAQQIALRRAIQECTGGTITHSGGRTIHTFTSSGTFNCTGSGTTTASVLVVGGGGGGSATGGGGGAGGYQYNASLVVSPQSYAVTVGNGGAGGALHTGAEGTNGDNSSFGALITATGGGGGGTSFGKNGGSGGGSGQICATVTYGGTGVEGQGFGGGGSGGTYTWPDCPAGGGGGAGAAGEDPHSSTVSGNGGSGVSNSISGTAVMYAGGGGGGSNKEGRTPGTGGTGGGGNGAAGDATASNATANTGGGGGGSGWQNYGGAGGNGGSGIVIVSYPSQ